MTIQHNQRYDKFKKGVQGRWSLFFSFFGTLIRFAICSALLSIGYGGVRYLLYLLSFVDKPTWWNVAGCAVGLWLIMIIYGLCSVAIFAFRAYKDPVFKEIHIKTGISWKDYQRLKRQKDERTKGHGKVEDAL